jgi:hypothetical protein
LILKPDAVKDGLRDPKCRVATPTAATRLLEDKDARFIAKQSPDGVRAEIPHLGDFRDRVVAFRGHSRTYRNG